MAKKLSRNTTVNPHSLDTDLQNEKNNKFLNRVNNSITNNPKKTKLFLGGLFSAIAVALILVFGNTQNNYIAESAENIFYDQYFKWATDVQDSFFLKDGRIVGIKEIFDKDNPIQDSLIEEIKDNNDSNIIIADIDEKSLQKLGSYYNWDRSIHAKVIENLSEGGAAAIAFDILFKDADFGKKKGNQCYEIFSQLDSDDNKTNESQAEHLSQIQSYYNHDSMLVEATQNSNICIVSYLKNTTSSYKQKSEWEPLSTWERAKEIGFSSTMELNQVDKPQDVGYIELLDNVFPKLANAGARVGAVNAQPDKDGIIRTIRMLYKFPFVTDNKLAPQRIYSTLSLMTILHLFHKDPKDVKIKMGEYIDIGKPFGIYRDSSGTLQTTFPNFTYPMFEALRLKMKQIKESGVAEAIRERTSANVTVRRDDDGHIVFETFTDEEQVYNAELSRILRKLPENIFSKLESSEKISLDKGFTLSKSEETEGFYVITDEEEEEVTITPNILHTIRFFENSYRKIRKGEHKNLSRNIRISYNKQKDEWTTSNSFFTNEILKEIVNVSDQEINNLKPNSELRFGPHKRIPIGKHGEYRIKYSGRFNWVKPESRAFKHVSYYDIYRDSTNLHQYAGKTIILGSSVPALFDIVNGPHEENIPAILVHANIIKNILEDDYLTILDENYQRYIVILLALIFTLIGLYCGSFASLIIALSTITLYSLSAYICFKHNIYIGVSRPILAIITSNTFAIVLRSFFEYLEKKRIEEEKKKIEEEKKKIEQEKKFITDTFKQYMAPELIDEIVDSGDMPQLGGEESVITAYFTDIQGFSTFSEQIGSASKLVELLNEYLTAMTDVLTLKNKGALDKYEGDAIIAFFGARWEKKIKNLDDPAKRACDTALDMQHELLRLRKKWISEKDKWPKVVHEMHMRIGINTGYIVTGNMGSDMRKNFTMMGDEVNLAARLESAAKQYGAYIHTSNNTIKQLVELGVIGNYIYRSLDIIRVVGKDKPVETFEFLAYSNDENAESLNKLCSLWKEARSAYLDMQWDKAIELFTQCLDFEPHHPERDPGSKTCPSMVYIKRCTAYKQNPPAHAGEKWDGIFTATEK